MDSVSALHPPSLFIDSYAPDPQPQEQHFGGTALDVSSMGFAGTASHPSSLSGPSDNAFRPRHHRDGNSVSSLRSRTPPLSASSHAGGTLAVPLPTVTSRLDPLANLGRRKEMLMDAHPDLMGQGGMGGMDLLGGLDVGYAGGASASAASPGGDNGNLSSRLVAELDLAMGGGCAIPIPEAMAIPLPGPVRAAIPGYLEVYWERVDPLLPLIHRQSFEAAPEDALKCAMAAIATQHLDSREDRVWGNQLHEFAWQEVKRVSETENDRGAPFLPGHLRKAASADMHPNHDRSLSGASRSCRLSSCASISHASAAGRPSHDPRRRSRLCIRG